MSVTPNLCCDNTKNRGTYTHVTVMIKKFIDSILGKQFTYFLKYYLDLNYSKKRKKTNLGGLQRSKCFTKLFVHISEHFYREKIDQMCKQLMKGSMYRECFIPRGWSWQISLPRLNLRSSILPLASFHANLSALVNKLSTSFSLSCLVFS